jgi:putative ABC transport system permease protein
MYVPFAQAPFPGVVLVARTPLDPAAAVSAIRHVVTGIDAHLPVTNIGMMPELLETSLSQQRFRTFLLAVFGMMALVLAAVGIFGVISYSVATRTHEIGVRMALGATRGAILRMVLWETAAVTAAGVALGLPAALAATRVIGHLLFAISPRDPTTLAAVVAGLAGVAALAGLLPARRATRVHPVIALRQD